MNITKSVILLSILSTANPEFALAQSSSGTLLGRVTDSSGAVVANASVQVTRQETNFQRTFRTNALGNYNFPIIDPGTYTIVVEAPGFKQFINRDVVLLAKQTLRVDVQLDLGMLSERVEVASQASAINTDTAQISETRTSKLLNEGPEGTTIMNRFGMDTAYWSLTIRSQSYGEDDYKSMGSRATMFETAVDGSAVDAAYVGPPFSAIYQEKDTVLNASAEQRTPVLIDAITKQGTNDLHGSFTIQYRHQAFNALSPGPPGEQRGPQTGMKFMNITGGGPVYIPKLYDGRNKSFFFLSAEREPPYDTRGYITQYIQAGNVPTLAMRNGDFSQYLAASQPGLRLVNPFNGMPFAGNVIPQSQWNPAAVNAINKFYPEPNFSGINNPNLPVQNDNQAYLDQGFYSQWFARGDQNIGKKNTAGFSYTHRINGPETFNDNNFWTQLNTLPNNLNTVKSNSWSWFDTHIFTPHVLNELRVGWYTFSFTRNTAQPASSVIDALGIDLGSDAAQRTAYNVIPTIKIQGFLGFGAAGQLKQIDENINWYQIRDNVTWQVGRHSLKFGYDQRFKHLDNNTVASAVVGDQSYTGRFSGNSFADFLLGVPEQTVQYDPRPIIQGRYSEFGAFVQDDFAVTPKLKLNLGFRVDRIGPRTDATDAYYNFDPRTGAIVLPNQNAVGLINPAFPSSIPIELASNVGYPSTLTNALFSPTPRLGVAWRPFQNTVLRTAYGIFAADAGTQNNNFALLQSGGPFAVSQTFVNQITKGVPLVTLNRPFPTNSTGVPPAFNISGVDPHLATPYMQQWNATIEHQLGMFWALRLSYVGAKTTHIIYQANINAPPPSLIPFTPSRNIYPAFQSVYWYQAGGNSTYHALQFGFTHRWQNGLSVDGLFQWQSEIADVADSSGYPIITDPYDRALDRGKAAIDPLDFRANVTYHFPFGPGQRFASSLKRGSFVSGLIGGWEFSGLFDTRSGRPNTVYFSGSDPSNTNTFGGRASVIPGCNIRPANGVTGPYLNIACFTVPAAGTFGDAARDIFRNPGMWDISGSLYKFFPLGFMKDKATLRFSITAANIFNHPTWGAVGNNISTPATFGLLEQPGLDARPLTGTGGRTMFIQGQVQF